MSEYKLFVHRIGLIGITQILVTLSSIILLPILTKNYSVSDYGIWVQINVTLILIPPAITLGLQYSMVRFLASKNKKGDIQEGFYSVALTVAVISLITAIILFILSDSIARIILNSNIAAAKILSFLVFFTALNLIYLNYFRTFQQMKIYSVLTLLQTYIMIILTSYIAVSGYSIATALIGILISQIIVFLMALIIITFNISFKIPKFVKIREYLSFGLPTVSSILSYWIVESSDKYIIGILLNAAFVGYYSPSYTLGNLIMMLVFPFTVLLPPLLSQYYDENKIETVRIFMKYSFKYFLVLAIPSMVGLSILSKIIIQILTTPEIAANGYFVTPFVALSALLYGIYNIILNILIINKKTRIIGMTWVIAAILNIFLNIVTIPYYGLLGSAVATLAAYVTAFVITVFYTLKQFRFDFDLIFVLKSVAATVPMSLIIFKFYPTGILSLIVMVIVGSLIYTASLFLLKGFKKEEFEFIKTLLK